jgi:hypothetical protein
MRNGKAEDLGALHTGLTTKWELLDEKLGPIADKIIDLKQQINDIPSEDREAQVEKINDKIVKLEKERDTLESVRGRAPGQRAVHGIEISFGKRARITKDIAALEAEREQVAGATSEEKLSTIAQKKLDKRKADLATATQERASVIATVPPSRMADSAWVDKNGKQWKITQATTKEIEANTNLRYYRNALASEISENLGLERAHAATQFIEN